MTTLRLLAALLTLLCVPAGWATSEPSYSQADVETAKLLRDDARLGTRAWNIVESLTTEVGPRLAGSEAEARARAPTEAELFGPGAGESDLLGDSCDGQTPTLSPSD